MFVAPTAHFIEHPEKAWIGHVEVHHPSCHFHSGVSGQVERPRQPVDRSQEERTANDPTRSPDDGKTAVCSVRPQVRRQTGSQGPIVEPRGRRVRCPGHAVRSP
jgi:hypothetical protein